MIRFTPYAEERLKRRRLSRALVEQGAENPQQVIAADDRSIAQSRYVDPGGGREYLLRVVYEQEGDDKLVVTVYRTSKVSKYWRPS